MKLLFTGDINFRELTRPTPKTCADILAEILPFFEKADFRIVNLETPLADNHTGDFGEGAKRSRRSPDVTMPFHIGTNGGF